MKKNKCSRCGKSEDRVKIPTGAKRRSDIPKGE